MAHNDEPPKLRTPEEKAMRTVSRVEVATPRHWNTLWKKPECQRDIKCNRKVLDLAKELKTTEVIPDRILIGILDGVMYLLDGWHRREAYFVAREDGGPEEVLVNVTYKYFDTKEAMHAEYTRVNDYLKKQRPDDLLRATEVSSPALQQLTKRCSKIVGYGSIRRSKTSPILSMSVALRGWCGAKAAAPTSQIGPKGGNLAHTMTVEDAEALCDFLTLAYDTWGRDDEFMRLWNTANLTTCMWLYHRFILDPHSNGATPISKALFRKCLMNLAVGSYYEKLSNRGLHHSTDRVWIYKRIQEQFVEVLRGEKMSMRTFKFPQPHWE